jgi:hypothetical protein
MGLLKVTADIPAALTDAAPDVNTVGLDLNQVEWYQVELDAPAGQTLSGAGSLLAYRRIGSTLRRVEDLDLTITVKTSGQAYYASGDIQVGVGVGTIIYRTSGITVSGGTVLALRYRYKQTL